MQYLGSDKLYIPVDHLDRIQKYIGGGEGAAPKLSRLDGKDWDKQKSKVRESLKELAFDLVKLYAERQKNTGYAFGPDTPWQQEFEENFPYDETPDQLQATEEIKRDMERDLPMDRLLCGDVGYGKTEVALRAAFKAVMDGKQVAILAPTTILAQQHYNTLMRRMEGFPVHADVLSRFRSAKEQKESLRRLKDGEIDIIVGTHRLLAKDVQFKNLGLLIVDEEQRFGVGHKESIKNMKKTVDVLTMSATPIPRTLHMSMVGIRDMSLLETPPQARYPVQTYVMEYQDSVIRDAILREIGRGGQVFFLYNRVGSIDQCYKQLSKLVPEARIAIAHGQMREHALEDVMLDFSQQKFDVLLCTTIIESGLDIPMANTLIIYDADHFGLGQLYQMRGRVGRSNRLAYAYFTVRPGKVLSETAQKRLDAIREFTEFGGFPPSGSSPASARASASRCAIWSCAARATCSARSRAATSPTSATICIASCWRKRFWRRRAKHPSRTATWRRAWMCTSTPISRRNTSRATGSGWRSTSASPPSRRPRSATTLRRSWSIASATSRSAWRTSSRWPTSRRCAKSWASTG